jgi:hypothetical protein
MMLRGIMHAMGKDLRVEDVVSHVLAQYHDRPIALDEDLRRSMLEMRHADAFVLAITKELLTLEAPGKPPLDQGWDTRPTKDDVFVRDHKSTDEVDDHPPTRDWRDED